MGHYEKRPAVRIHADSRPRPRSSLRARSLQSSPNPEVRRRDRLKTSASNSTACEEGSRVVPSPRPLPIPSRLWRAVLGPGECCWNTEVWSLAILARRSPNPAEDGLIGDTLGRISKREQGGFSMIPHGHGLSSFGWASTTCSSARPLSLSPRRRVKSGSSIHEGKLSHFLYQVNLKNLTGTSPAMPLRGSHCVTMVNGENAVELKRRNGQKT